MQTVVNNQIDLFLIHELLTCLACVTAYLRKLKIMPTSNKSTAKGQIISEGNCDVLNQRKNLTNFCPSTLRVVESKKKALYYVKKPLIRTTVPLSF